MTHVALKLVPRNPLEIWLEKLGRDRGALLAEEWTKDASRRLDALDNLSCAIWAILHEKALEQGDIDVLLRIVPPIGPSDGEAFDEPV